MTSDELEWAVASVTRDAMRSHEYALECALEMALECLAGEDWRRVAVKYDTAGRWMPCATVTIDGRVIHRQWWEQEGEYTLVLRQEWCP